MSSKAQQSEATRGKLLRVGRDLFAEAVAGAEVLIDPDLHGVGYLPLRGGTDFPIRPPVTWCAA